MPSEVTLQINLSGGDVAYAETTVPPLVAAHRATVHEVLGIVDCVRPQRTQMVDPEARFPLATFNQRCEEIRTIADRLVRDGTFDRVVYVDAGDSRTDVLLKKYVGGLIGETHDCYGCGLVTYLYGFDEARTRYLLHYDADMLLYQAAGYDWSEAGLVQLAADPNAISATPRVSAPFADELCEYEAVQPGPRPDAVHVERITIKGDHAIALVTNQGGSFDGSTTIVRLLDDNGSWKVDRIMGFSAFNRTRFDRAYRRTFLEFGASTADAECALARDRRLSDAEIERATVDGLHRVFGPIAVACDRQEIERSMMKTLADPGSDLSFLAIECAERRVGASTNSELVRLQLNPVAWGTLVMACDPNAFFISLKHQLTAGGDLDPGAIGCVVRHFRRLSPSGAIRLSYDDLKYNELIVSCT